MAGGHAASRLCAVLTDDNVGVSLSEITLHSRTRPAYRPHMNIAAWIGVLASFVLTLLGPTFKLWDRILAIRPFWHIPTVVSADADGTGLLWISAVLNPQ